MYVNKAGEVVPSLRRLRSVVLYFSNLTTPTGTSERECR